MAIKIAECACCGNRDSSRFIQKNDGYICKTCGVWFRYETEEEKSGCMDGRRRLKNYRFDDAKETFMEVLDKYPDSIDALWGSLLARYGIVFVKGFFDDTSEPIYCFPEYDEYGGRRFQDERAYKKILRLLEEKDEDLRVSDFYESKAKEIDRAIEKYSECKNNTDVDIFICVKISAATEEDPQASGRTPDYEYALRVYNDLQKRGVNAFFSFVTLKNNVESDDLIWVNLVKSKKMLIIGSTEEYLDSVWVKSEWKRWLYLGREKDLYICSMKHDNEYPKAILPRELASLHPQVYTLDTYEKMINELCEDIIVPEVTPPSGVVRAATAVTQSAARTTSPSADSDKPDGKVIYADGSEEAIKYGVREIGMDTYRNNKDIVSVVLPESVKKIQVSAFAGCASLESITLPKDIKHIGSWAFKDCESLESITIPSSAKNINQGTFFACESLGSVTIEDGVETIDNQAFYGCASLKEITVPDSVTFIGSGVFKGCTSLESITMPKNITSTIGNAIFDKCKKLVKITLPEGATAIDGWAFQDCSNIAEINIPETVTSIGTGAFWNCSQIKSINIPQSVTSIAERAFAGCTGLRDVYYSGTEDEWERISIDAENTAFEKAKMHFNSPLKHPANKSAPAPQVINTDGEIVYKNGKKEAIPYGTTELSDDIAFDENIVSVIFPASITSIKDCAFCGCSALQSITLPETLTEICFTAFSYCTSLKSITIPAKVNTIGPNPFVGCNVAIDISPKNEHFKLIGKNLYSIDGKKIISYVPGENENTFTIPEGVTNIGEHALCGSLNLASVTIPASVTEIGASAFYGCDSLKNIYYNGSAADWKKITIVSGNEKLNGGIFKRAKIHYNSK